MEVDYDSVLEREKQKWILKKFNNVLSKIFGEIEVIKYSFYSDFSNLDELDTDDFVPKSWKDIPNTDLIIRYNTNDESNTNINSTTVFIPLGRYLLNCENSEIIEHFYYLKNEIKSYLYKKYKNNVGIKITYGFGESDYVRFLEDSNMMVMKITYERNNNG